jgi:hypothetical protein
LTHLKLKRLPVNIEIHEKSIENTYKVPGRTFFFYACTYRNESPSRFIHKSRWVNCIWAQSWKVTESSVSTFQVFTKIHLLDGSKNGTELYVIFVSEKKENLYDQWIYDCLHFLAVNLTSMKSSLFILHLTVYTCVLSMPASQSMLLNMKIARENYWFTLCANELSTKNQSK